MNRVDEIIERLEKYIKHRRQENDSEKATELLKKIRKNWRRYKREYVVTKDEIYQINKIKAAIEAKFKISDVEALRGATSIGWPKPINKGPIFLPPPKTFINLVEIAALWSAGMIKMFAFPTIFENG